MSHFEIASPPQSRSAQSTSAKRPNDSPVPKGGVILIHGLLNPNCVLWPIGKRFRNAGYMTLNCGYNSFGRSIEGIAQGIKMKCQQFHDELPESVPLYIIGHSLGSILCRRIVQLVELPKLRRVVMLAPPNRGSHVASRLGKLVKRLVPAVDELADREESYVNQLPLSFPCEVGVIAADPDFVIRLDCTHLENEADHILEPGPHASLIFRESVFVQSLHFLEQGHFLRHTES